VSSSLVSVLLAWSGVFEVPPGCGTEATFREQLHALVGADASRAMPSSLQISGPEADGHFRLRLRQGDEQRELRDVDCPTLLRSAAVIAAAAVTPSTAPGATTDEDPAPLPPPPVVPVVTPEPTPTQPQAPPEPQRDAPEPQRDAPQRDKPEPEPQRDEPEREPPERAGRAARSPRARPPWQGELGLSAGIAYGIVPKVGAALEAVGGFARGPWGLRLTLRYIPTTRAETDGRSVAVMAAGGRAIARREIIPYLHLGVGADVDWLRGEGEGVPDAATAQVWMLSPSLELTVVPLPKPRLRLEIGVVGRVAAWRPRFEITGYGEIYETPRFAVLATLRGVWIFR